MTHLFVLFGIVMVYALSLVLLNLKAGDGWIKNLSVWAVMVSYAFAGYLIVDISSKVLK